MFDLAKKYPFFLLVCLCLLLPVGILWLGEYPGRNLLKNFISAITLGAFFLMLMQMFMVRSKPLVSSEVSLQSVVKWHKAVGYLALGVLCLHPFLLVVPRYFEAGVSPSDALVRILSSIESRGIVLGWIAYVLMLLIGITSMFRKWIPLRYHVWRQWHGYLSIIFIIVASWHVMELGRHISTLLNIFICFAAGMGIFLLLKRYWWNPSRRGSEING